MNIAVTSGKGGVGKTFVAACLARVLSGTQPVRYIDCDVEAPNAHLFLKPEDTRTEPQILSCITGMDPDKCTHCGRCVKACWFNALIIGKNAAMAFPELCRWCGACRAICPTDALTVGQRQIGTVYQADSDGIDLHWATLAAGAGGMTVRLIKHIQNHADNMLTILDSPPGTSCAVVQTIRSADRVVLVSDPTRFGLHDLKLSVHLCRQMDIKPLVIVNRAGIGDLDQFRRWCQSVNVPVIAEIPDDRAIAECYSKGLLPVDHIDALKPIFAQIAEKLTAPETESNQPIAENHANGTVFHESPGENTAPAETFAACAKPLEITVVSGKGGTGKTSLSACFAQLASGVIADCDVDAADMHLLLAPRVLQSDDFSGGRVMSIDPDRCVACGACVTICQWDAVTQDGKTVTIDADACEGCGACMQICPTGAIVTRPTLDGRAYWSDTRFGRLSHAVLEPGKENSGKLVTLVRNTAAQRSNGASIAVLDGSPGTGCPVIASVGGTALAVIVTEPTVSGLHDLKRIGELTRHFNIPAGVIINKADLNASVRDDIAQYTREQNAALLGELPYDKTFIDAQQQGQTILEYQPDGPLADAVRAIWENVLTILNRKTQ
jgi:MinD superfamily P-loop ATPase